MVVARCVMMSLPAHVEWQDDGVPAEVVVDVLLGAVEEGVPLGAAWVGALQDKVDTGPRDNRGGNKCMHVVLVDRGRP